MKKKGNAFIEFVLILPLFLIFILAMVSFSNHLLLKMRALSLARFGAWLESNNLLSGPVVEREMKDYQDHLSSPHQKPWEFKIGRYREGAGRFYQLDWVQVQAESSLGPIQEGVVIQHEIEGEKIP